jgi:hypothetical protein
MRLVLGILIGLLALPLLSVQADLPEMCHKIPTHYAQLRAGWFWQDEDTVFFSVHPGNYGSAIFRNPVMWYAYHPSTDELVELRRNPYLEVRGTSVPPESLLFIPRNKWGSYEDVSVSPLGDALVYSEYDPKTAMNHHWYENRLTGQRIELMTRRNYIPLKIFWSANGQRFVVEDYNNGLSPTRVFTLHGSDVITQYLNDTPHLQKYGLLMPVANLRVYGISPDGKYIVGMPELNYETWLFDWDQNEVHVLNFSLHGDNVVWLNNTTFVAMTNLGVIEYDVEDRAMKIRPTTESIASFAGNLSPDGKFNLIQQWGGTENTGLWVCRVG